jgi:hypothetical protein
MISYRKPILVALVLALSLPSLASAKDKPNTDKPTKLTDEGRALIIRTFNAEYVFSKRYFPMGKIGLKVNENGVVTPTDGEVRQLVADWGPAAKPGDRVKITNVIFKKNGILFELNGGPVKRKKWYERIQVGSVGGSVAPMDKNPQQQDIENVNARGSYVMLAFKDYVPEMTTQQIKTLLSPVLDFNAATAAEAYLKSQSPIVQDALKNHKALVGMDREMVMYAKGRPPKKYRDRDGDTDYEEWIYGTPPQEVEFVRFVGDRVVRIEEMKVDGQKVVRTAKEVDIDKDISPAALAQKQEPQEQQKAPSLLRPGEKTVQATPGARGAATPLPKQTSPSSDPNPSGMPDASQGPPGTGVPGSQPMPPNVNQSPY